MTEVAIFRGRAVTFTEPLSRPVGTSRDFGTKTHTHTQCTERRSIWVHGQTYIQSPISWTVRGEKWRGLSALHPSKCLMNHLSLSLLAQLLTHHLLFPSLHPCLSVSSLSLFLQANRRHILVQDEVWMLTRKVRRRRKAHLHPISLHSSNISFVLTQTFDFLIYFFLWWDSLRGGRYLAFWLDVCFHVNHVRKSVQRRRSSFLNARNVTGKCFLGTRRDAVKNAVTAVHCLDNKIWLSRINAARFLY